MKEIHKGTCGNHFPSTESLEARVLLAHMKNDALSIAKYYEKCQKLASIP